MLHIDVHLLMCMTLTIQLHVYFYTHHTHKHTHIHDCYLKLFASAASDHRFIVILQKIKLVLISESKVKALSDKRI